MKNFINIDDAKEFLMSLLKLAVENNATDTYLVTGFSPAFKIDGVLSKSSDILLESDIRFLATIILQELEEEFSNTKEVGLAYITPDGHRFRVSVYTEQNRPAIVLRKINIYIPTIAELKLPKIISDLILERNGLVLVVGQTGSGKSTTLAAMIDHRNKNSHGFILSLEDPIEYVHQHQNCIVSQREIGIDSKSWHNAIKSALRQAPNLILIGEIRDAESMEYALQFAETGHLCVATIHANNALQAIDRVLNLFPSEKHNQIKNHLSINLRAIIGQRLIPVINGGRCIALDIMLNNSTISDYIVKYELGKIKEIMSKSSDTGMCTFDQSIYNLYEQSIISYVDAMKNADSVNDLRLNIKLNSKLTSAIEENTKELKIL